MKKKIGSNEGVPLRYSTEKPTLKHVYSGKAVEVRAASSTRNTESEGLR